VSGTERDWRRRLWGNGPPATPPHNKTPEGQDKASHTRNNSRSNSPLKAPGSSSNETAEGRQVGILSKKGDCERWQVWVCVGARFDSGPALV
jgi:hypothetical protein